MLAARRTAPIATDFESAFQAAQVPTPEDQLPPRIRRKLSSPPSLLPTPPPDDFFNTHELPESILGANLNPKQEKRRDPHIPSSFPAFPSQHTFRDTPVLPPRERDPRRIRELATEEGRLGEQALRKLAGAAKGEVKLDLSIEAVDVPVDAQRAIRRKKVETMEGMFEETMKELAKTGKGIGMRDATQTPGFEMAPIVNSERKFWMPDTSRRKAGRLETSHKTAKTGAHHHALSEKARGKQKASDPPPRPADDDSEMQFS
jgi:Transcription factor TFIID complex subunit 8 C-term